MARPVRYRRRRPEERTQYAVPLNQRTGPPPGPEILPWYWHPDREGAVPPPAAFAEQLALIDMDLRVCYSPVHERWLVWVRNVARKNSLCTGWQLIFLWEHPITKAFLQLDELIFHNLYLVSAARFPNAVGYFDKIQDRVAKAKAAKEATYQADRKTSQKDIFDSFKISTAGNGSKSALHHSGTVVESPGELAWRAETRKHRLPGEQIRREADEKEKQFYGRE